LRDVRLVLLKPEGEGAFVPFGRRRIARPGDTVVTFAARVRTMADVAAINTLFYENHYVRGADRTRFPDEIAIARLVIPRSGARILDVCCGSGRTTEHLVRRGNAVVGVDSSAAAIRAGNARRSPVRYRRGDALALPLGGAGFDITLCVENSLALFPGCEARVLAELIRVTAPGGRVVLGLRRQSGKGRLLFYYTAAGHVEVSRSFERADVTAIVASLPSAVRARIRSTAFWPGWARPWGGKTFYLDLQLR
jgi:SAM-dependent methyltransferase